MTCYSPAGASPNLRQGVTQVTPLHCAVDASSSEGEQEFERVFCALAGAGGRLDACAARGGDTPLYRAVLTSKNHPASLLIKHGSVMFEFKYLNVMLFIKHGAASDSRLPSGAAYNCSVKLPA